MKNKKILVMLGLSVALLCLGRSRLCAEVVDRIVAIVNNDVITQADLNELLAPIYAQYKNTYPAEEVSEKMAKAGKDMLNQMVEEKLILQEAKKQNITVEDKDVEERLSEIKSRFESESMFKQALLSQDLTLSQLRRRYREQLMIEKLADQNVRAKVSVTPVEVNDYYTTHRDEFFAPERVRLRAILIGVKNRGEEEAQKRAEEVLNEIKNGADFVAMVEKYSEDTNVAGGGQMPEVARGTLLPDIDAAVFNLNIGDISPVVRTKSGFYIFKVEDKKDKKVQDISEVRQQIHSFLSQEKASRYYRDWIDKLKENAYISISD